MIRSSVYAFVMMVAMYCSAVNAIKLGQIEVFSQPGCNTSSVVVPFLVGDKCSPVSGAGAMKYNCTANALQMFPAAGCADAPSVAIPFVCAGNLKLSCAEFPDNKVLTFELGGSCDAGAIVNPFLDVAVLVNTCIQDQRDAFEKTTKSGFFMVTVDANGQVVYTGYSDKDCTVGATVAFTGRLDQCETIQTRRRLQAGGPTIGAVAFRTAVAGANIERTNGAVGATLNLVLGAFVVLGSVLALQ